MGLLTHTEYKYFQQLLRYGPYCATGLPPQAVKKRDAPRHLRYQHWGHLHLCMAEMDMLGWVRKGLPHLTVGSDLGCNPRQKNFEILDAITHRHNQMTTKTSAKSTTTWTSNSSLLIHRVTVT